MIQIEPYPLWLGNAGSCRDPAALHDAGIRAVVQLAIEEPPAMLPREMLSFRIPLLDGSGNEHLDLRLAVDLLANLIAAGTQTLVCCSGGISRSPAVAACAVARMESIDPIQALERLAGVSHLDVSPALWRELLAALSM